MPRKLNLQKRSVQSKTTTIKKRNPQPPLSDPVDDPFANIDYSTGNIEEQSTKEASALLSSFKQRAQQEEARFTLATDSEFWFAIGFQSRDQKEAFLQAMEWLEHGDKYLNGLDVAEQMGIEIEPIQLPDPTKRRVDRKLRRLTRKGRGKS